MATPHIQKRAASSVAKRKVRGRKRASVKPSTTVGYAFSGDIGDLSVVVKRGHLPSGFRTLVIPENAEVEEALERSERFSKVRIDMVRRRNLTLAKGVKAIKEGAKTELIKKALKAGIATEAFHPSARARAILRGKEYATEDLRAAGGTYSVEEVRSLLNHVSRQAVDKRVNEGSVLAVPGPSGRRRFPTTQFNRDGSVVKGLKEVQEALGFSSPWAVLNFLVNGNDHLSGKRPIEVLRKGEVEPVIAAANSVGVQGA